MNRLLIIGCSETKRHDPGKLPALERYDGPAFRVLRRARKAGHLVDTQVFILSAEYGLIDEDRLIADYDRRMTAERARELAPEVSSELLRWLLRHPECQSACVNLGRSYAPALDGFGAWCGRHGVAVVAAQGGIGARDGQMKAWLEGQA